MYLKSNILIINGTKGLGFYLCKYFLSKQFQILLLDNSLNNLNKYTNYFNNQSQSLRVFPIFCNLYNKYQLEASIKYIKINFKKIDFVLNNNIIYSNFSFANKRENTFNIILKYFFYIINYYKFLFKNIFLINKDTIFYNTITLLEKKKNDMFLFNYLSKNYRLFNKYFFYLYKKYKFFDINFFVSDSIFDIQNSILEVKIFKLFESCFSIFSSNENYFLKNNNYFIKF